MANELEALIALLDKPEDAAALKEIMGRNIRTSERVVSSVAVYDAFVEGKDPTPPAVAAVTPAAPVAAAAAIDLSALEAMVDQRTSARAKAYVESPEYLAAEEARIEKMAKKVAESLAPQLLTNAARSADEIYQVRRSHEKEFGEELDTPKFTEFLNTNTGKFADLSKAHDAYVQEQRITAQIAKGVSDELAKRQTNEVPGTTLPSAESPLGSMIRANKLTVGETARGPALDAAAKAWRHLRGAHVN